MENNKVQITVIVATYNPEFEKLRKTIVSILNQRRVELQIIVTDDGSKESYFDELKRIFKNSNFTNFKLLTSDSNKGTCKNIEKSLQYIQFEYIKLISPGDYLFNENVLYDWYYFMLQNNLSVSFGRAIYYVMNEGNPRIVIKKANPRNRYLYGSKKYKTMTKIAYLVLRDYALGAAFLLKKEIFIEYFNLIVDKVKYLEDGIFRIMMIDNIPLIEYPHTVIWYEYGTGVSTSKKTKWEKAMYKDSIEIIKIIEERNASWDSFSRRYVKYYRKKYAGKLHQEIIRSILFPQYIIIKIRDMINAEKTVITSDFTYIKNL